MQMAGKLHLSLSCLEKGKGCLSLLLGLAVISDRHCRDSTLLKLLRPDELPRPQDSPLRYVALFRPGASQLPSSLRMETKSLHRAALASMNMGFKTAPRLEFQLP